MKFRQFKPLFSDEFETSSNAGHKPNCTPTSRVREAPQALVDQQRDQRDEGIRLRISKSPESNTWRSAEVQNQRESSTRFADPDMNLKRRFELHLRKDLPRLVHRCQGNCGKQITEDCVLILNSLEQADGQTKTETKDPNLDRCTFILRKIAFKTLTQKITMDLLKVLTTVA